MAYQGLDVSDFYRHSSQATAESNRKNPLFSVGRKAGDAFGSGFDNVQSGLGSVLSNTGINSILGGMGDEYQSELNMASSALGAIAKNIGLDKEIAAMKSRGGGGGGQKQSTGDKLLGIGGGILASAAGAGVTALI